MRSVVLHCQVHAQCHLAISQEFGTEPSFSPVTEIGMCSWTERTLAPTEDCLSLSASP